MAPCYYPMHWEGTITCFWRWEGGGCYFIFLEKKTKMWKIEEQVNNYQLFSFLGSKWWWFLFDSFWGYQCFGDDFITGKKSLLQKLLHKKLIDNSESLMNDFELPGEPSDLDQFTKTLPLPKTKYFVTPDPPQNNHDHCCSKFIFYFGFQSYAWTIDDKRVD